MMNFDNRLNKPLPDEEVNSADSNALISAVDETCESSFKSLNDVPLSKVKHTVETEVGASTTQAEVSSHISRPTRRKSRRKRVRNTECSDRAQCAKDKLLHCVSSADVRRWCAYEWFYSAIDYPWFVKREFVEYLNFVGLARIPRFTRVEWDIIRSSVGKPRRLSERFLQEEREKLKQYRESVRTHYANFRGGFGAGLPIDLARPLSVGQQVIAIHPKTRELQNASVLAVDRQSCLVQFDRRDLGAEIVMDIDCMPLNLVENMPQLLRRPKIFHHQTIGQEAFASSSDVPVKQSNTI